MTEVIFRLNEQELDRMLADARPELEQRGVAIADGSARDALVWAMSFSLERPQHRVATTITLNDESPLSVQSVAIGARLTHRIDTQPLPWPELRRRGMAEVVLEHLTNAEAALQKAVGASYAYEEFARRCDRLLDLIGDDVPNADSLRERVTSWRDEANARTLYSRARPSLINEYQFGHLDDDVRALNEFYVFNISRPLATGAQAGKPAPHEATDHSRRPAILDNIPKAAAAATSGEPVNVVGIILLAIAIIVLAIGIVRVSWPVIVAGAILLLLVVRAMLQWRG
jgi:hypothetical protein